MSELANMSWAELLDGLRRDLLLDATTDLLPGTVLASLIDNNGRSAFLQLASAVNPSHRVYNFGQTTVTFAAAAVSATVNVAHGLTTGAGAPIAPGAVVFGALGGAAFCGVQVISLDVGGTHTQFSIQGYDTAGTARTGTNVVCWAALV